MIALSQKDRRALLICGAALLLFALVQFVLFPLLEARKRLERSIAQKEKGLTEMRAMQAQISRSNRQSSTLSQRAAARPPGFSLFDFLEKKGAEAHVKESILYMKPSDPEGEGGLRQAAVEMKLQAVQLKELVAFLELIESPENIVELERINILVNKQEKGALDAVMRIVSVTQAKESAN